MKRIAKRICALFLTITMVCGMTMVTVATDSVDSQSENSTKDTTFRRVKLSFDYASDGDCFSNTNWSVTDGHWQADVTWQATWLTQAFPLSDNLNISFDFYIDYTGDMANSLLAFGFMNADQTKGTVGWLQRSQWGDLLTWTKDGLGGPTSNTYVGDHIIRTSEQVSAGDSVFGSVHHVNIALSNGSMTVIVDDVLMSCTNSASLTCDITEGYFTLLSTNTSAYIDNLSVVRADIADDYCEDFNDLSVFETVQYATNVAAEEDKFIGTGWSGIDYKLPVENYRLDMTITLNAQPNGANENCLYFGVPDKNFDNGGGGYLLHFYNHGTYLFDNSVSRTGWYDENAIISSFTTPSNLQNDGKLHDLTLVVYDQQFYLLIDGVFFEFGSEDSLNDIYTTTDAIGAGYIRFIGHDWEISKFDITCFGGTPGVANSHFQGLRAIYRKMATLDSTLYSEKSWSKIETYRDEYVKKMYAIKDGTDDDTMNQLATEVIQKIEGVPAIAIVDKNVVGENQVLIGYHITGGEYDGLYNYEIGDTLPDEEGLTIEPVIVTMYMQAGASVRLKEGSGIRWTTCIPKEDYEKLQELGVSIGTHITTSNSDKFIDIPLVHGLNTNDELYRFIGALIHIKESNYNRLYNGCAYATVTYADGTTDNKYAICNDNERTYKYLINAAYEDVKQIAEGEYLYEVEKDESIVYSPYTEEQYAFLKQEVAKIISSEVQVDASAYSANDTVFENISVPYQECDAAYTVYVSPKGNDENAGTTLDTAVLTLEQAQMLVRAYRNNGGTGDCQVLLDDGEYFLADTLNFTAEDTASDGQLYIRSIHANEATLTGSQKIAAENIEEVVDNTLGRVWKIPCSENVNQLYVDNSYAVRARFPDAGEELRLLNWDTIMRTILIDSSDIDGFEASEIAGSTLVANIMWAESYLRVAEVEIGDKTSAVSLVAADSGVFSRSKPRILARQSYHFENAKVFLSTYGEWYYSAEEAVIYYLPYEYETLDNTTVRVPYTEELITFKGTADESVENVIVEGLNFKWTSNEHIDGKLGNQANKDDGSNKRFAGTQNDGRAISAMTLEYASNITFRGNIFTSMGGGALDFVEGVQDTTVEKNIFQAIGGNGIFAGATNYSADGLSTEEVTFIKNIKVENNYFNEIGWQEYSSCAVMLNYAVDSTISYNTINNVKYSAISVGWGWKKTELPFLQNIEISYNKVTNANSFLSDGGAIYLVGCQPNSVIKGNYIDHCYNSVYKYPHDMLDGEQIKWATAGIYLDQGVGGTWIFNRVQVKDNVVVEEHVDIQTYLTHNAKAGYYVLTEPDDTEIDAIKEAAGVQEDGFTLLPKTTVLYGTHVESVSQVSVYGENLGTKDDSVLILKHTNGDYVSLASEDLISWETDKITFKTSNYQSGDAFVLRLNGLASNKLSITCNVDEDYCMYTRFEEDWGGLDGLDSLLVQQQALSEEGYSCSTSLEAWPASAIGDGDTSTGWSSGDGDTNPWVQLTLAENSTVEKILLYARAGYDQEECRRNFNIYGVDENGDEYLIYQADTTTPVFDANGMLIVDISNTIYKNTVFQSFRIARPEGDSTYFFVAEITVI